VIVLVAELEIDLPGTLTIDLHWNGVTVLLEVLKFETVDLGVEAMIVELVNVIVT
jgi:hypothetical protein